MLIDTSGQYLKLSLKLLIPKIAPMQFCYLNMGTFE